MTQLRPQRRDDGIAPADEYGARKIDFSPHPRPVGSALPIPLPLPILDGRRDAVASIPVRFAEGAPRPVPQPRRAPSRAAAPVVPPGVVVPLPERADDGADKSRRADRPRRARARPVA